jgi:hypothetical protein
MLPVLPLILLGGGAIALFTLGGGKKANADGTAESTASKFFTELKRAADADLAGTSAQRAEYAAVGLAMISIGAMRQGSNLNLAWDALVNEAGSEKKARDALYAESRVMNAEFAAARAVVSLALNNRADGPVTYKQFFSFVEQQAPTTAQATVDEAKRLGHTVNLNNQIPMVKAGRASVGGCGSRFRGCMNRHGVSTWPIRPNC